MSKTINDLEKMLDKDIEASSLSGKKTHSGLDRFFSSSVAF